MENEEINKVIRFFGHHKTTESLKFRFWDWLVSPSHTQAKEQALSELWDDTSSEMDSNTIQSLKYVIDKNQNARTKRQMMMRLMKVAAVIAIPLLSVVGAWLYVNSTIHDSELVEYTTSRGEQRKIVLSDGTRVVMNAESFLTCPRRFNGDKRTIILSGEANFDVHKDARHPFIVKTSSLAIQALGTKFNVQAYPDDSKSITTLERGKIKVTNVIYPKQVFILNPNQRLIYDLRSRLYVQNDVDTDISAGWIDGELNFVNTTLGEMIATLQRNYHVDIAVSSKIHDTDYYTLKIKKGETLRNIIKLITLTVGGIDAKFKDEHSILLIPSSSKVTSQKGGRRE